MPHAGLCFLEKEHVTQDCHLHYCPDLVFKAKIAMEKIKAIMMKQLMVIPKEYFANCFLKRKKGYWDICERLKGA